MQEGWGRLWGMAALAVAAIGIFVPLGGITLSALAVLLAVIAALDGEAGYAAGTSAIVAINSILLSPVLWITVMWPGQIRIALFVAAMVALPLVALAVTAWVPRWRFGIMASIAWLIAVPVVAQFSNEDRQREAFHRGMRECRAVTPADAPDINKLCYDAAKRAEDAVEPHGALNVAAFAVGLLPLLWLFVLALMRVFRPFREDGGGRNAAESPRPD